MATLEDLLAQARDLQNTKGQLALQMQGVDDSIAHVHICIAEDRNINRNAITYNLPAETLSELFEAGLFQAQSSMGTPHVESKQQARFEIIISSVCRRWRNIALRTPRLWTDVRINVSRSTVDLLDLYNYRSKNCSLDITFEELNKGGDFNPDRDFVVKNFRCHLERLVSRWRKFVVRGVWVSLCTALSPLADLHAPLLEAMTISGCFTDHTVLEMFSSGAPVLSSLELGEQYIWPPRGALVSLTLNIRLSHTHFTQFMLPMRSLTHLCVRSDPYCEPTAHSLIELPSLTSLEFSLLYSTSVGVLRSVDVPALETLVIHSYTHDVIEAFTDHHRHYPVLRLLKIISRGWPKRDQLRDTPAAKALDFISLLPNVQDVTFRWADPTTILHALHNDRPRARPLWPELSAITVISMPAIPVNFKKKLWTCINQLVENRLVLRCPISSIKLTSQILERGSHKQQLQLRERVVLTELEEESQG